MRAIQVLKIICGLGPEYVTSFLSSIFWDTFLNIFQYDLLSTSHCHVALCCCNDFAFILNQTKLLYKSNYT